MQSTEHLFPSLSFALRPRPELFGYASIGTLVRVPLLGLLLGDRVMEAPRAKRSERLKHVDRS